MRKTTAQLLAILILNLCFLAPAVAEERGHLTLGVGAFEVAHSDARAAEAFVNYRFSPRLFADKFGPVFRGIGPMLGLNANTDGGVFGYGDLFLDIRPTENIVIWPSAGIGGYRQGNSRSLGGIFQFHAELFAGYRISERQMIGISYQHISNAGTHDSNPTADSIYATYTLTTW